MLTAYCLHYIITCALSRIARTKSALVTLLGDETPQEGRREMAIQPQEDWNGPVRYYYGDGRDSPAPDPIELVANVRSYRAIL